MSTSVFVLLTGTGLVGAAVSYSSSGQSICLQRLSCPEQLWRLQPQETPQQGRVQRQRNRAGL